LKIEIFPTVVTAKNNYASPAGENRGGVLEFPRKFNDKYFLHFVSCWWPAGIGCRVIIFGSLIVALNY
jgi:hypothetical protein